jgi:sugar phosphate permease
MTKVVSENTEPLYATRCSLGYTFASFFGSPLAGVLATFLAWQSVFAVSSGLLFLMSVVAFCLFTAFERRGIVRYNQFKPAEKGAKNIKVLFEHGIVKFTLISMITGVVRTSVVFWLPTYISQYHGYSPEDSAKIYTIATLAISFTAFIAVFIYEKMGFNINKTVLLMFSSATVFFALTYFIKFPLFNIVCIVLAIMSSNGAATMLWSRYCPSLRDTGMVSSVTGFIDFLSYISAAAANIVFANAATSIGWGNLILVWFGIVFMGVLLSFPFSKRRF